MSWVSTCCSWCASQYILFVDAGDSFHGGKDKRKRTANLVLTVDWFFIQVSNLQFIYLSWVACFYFIFFLICLRIKNLFGNMLHYRWNMCFRYIKKKKHKRIKIFFYAKYRLITYIAGVLRTEPKLHSKQMWIHIEKCKNECNQENNRLIS